MHSLRIVNSGKRLNVTLSGHFSVNNAHTIIREIKIIAPRLKSGFDVVNDIRHIQPLSPEVAKQIKTGSKILEKHGAKNIIRVVGASKYSLTLFARFANLTSKTKIYFVPTMEAAEEKLNQVSIFRKIMTR